MRCSRCHQDVMEASRRGAYLIRLNPKGVDGIWACYPTCDGDHGTQDDALLSAIKGGEE
jgi:hypothetical protein